MGGSDKSRENSEVRIMRPQKKIAELEEKLSRYERVEEALRASEERYRSVVESMNIGVAIIGPDMEIISLNNQMRMWFPAIDVSVRPVCYKAFNDPPTESVCPLCPTLKTFEDGKVHEQVRGTPSGGNIRYFRIIASPLRGEHGNVSAVVEIVEDITKKKRSDELLRREKETLFTVLRKAPYGAVLIDRKGNYLYMNEEFTSITGYTRKDVSRGVDFFLQAYPDPRDRKAAADAWKKDMAVKGVTRIFTIRCKSGEEKEIEFRPTRLDQDRYLLMLSDITERRRAEALLRKAHDELELRVRERTEELVRTNKELEKEIAVRKKTEEALKEREQTTMALLNATSDAVLLVDTQWKIIMANNNLGTRLGKLPEELTGEYFSSYFREGPAEARREIFQGVIEAKTPILFEDYRDGMWLENSVYPVIDSRGQVTKLAIYSRDITERKYAEELLKQAEEKYRSIFENAVEGIFRNTPEGQMIAANPALAKMLGYDSPEELTDVMTDVQNQIYTDPAYHPRIIQILEKDGVALGFNCEFQRKDGSTIWVTLNVRAVRDRQGRPLYYDGTVENITERKQAEEALRASEEKFRRFFETMPEYAYIVSPNGRMVDINPAALQALGYERDEVIGKPLTMIYAPESMPRMRDLYARWKESGTIRDEEIVIQTKQLEKRTVILNVSTSRHAEGTILHSASVQTDITERKGAEEEIGKLNEELNRRIMELAAVNTELESFTYSISHDLKTPLIAVEGLSRILLDRYGGQLDGKGQKLLSVIIGSAIQVKELAEDLLAFFTVGRQEIRYSAIDMKKMVSDVFEQLKAAHQGRRLELLLKPTPAANGDRNMIRQVVLNLLGNSIKFSRVRAVARVEFGGWTEQDGTVFYVRDNGVGFPMEHKERLFEVFKRLHLSEEFEGTGIGLATVKRIVQRHGGQVWAEGKVNEGATFYFSLPYREDGERCDGPQS
ncbi:MAG: Phytochrome-like protein cph1 [Syntrophorhabdus sp. PtaB.Bin006]|nr:MAG: Phytochrome-like protein cph1 [Syntrophorhabdus sp. PtaB.Bin006]